MPIRPLLLGHRGVRAEKAIPENTLTSFDLALAQGCDGFEFDVRRSADGQAVICHDASTQGREIAHSSAEQLALPLLREILTRYRGSAFLDIELKVPGLERITRDLLRVRTRPRLRGFFVSSRNATNPSRDRCRNPARLDLRDASPVHPLAQPAYRVCDSTSQPGSAKFHPKDQSCGQEDIGVDRECSR